MKYTDILNDMYLYSFISYMALNKNINKLNIES